ncbi:plasmid pRiA4b ORF-3 family protein [Verrucomicrobiaceae bacterium 227]
MAKAGDHSGADFGPAMGEVEAGSLARLEELLERMPAEGADEAEVDAFMEEVMALDGGMEMIRGLAEPLGKISITEESEYVRPVSVARLMFRVEILGTKPGIWRRVSMPADVSFFDLHCAIQDSFGWLDVGEHRFEVREGGEVELVFQRKPAEMEFDEVTSPVSELVLNGVSQFHYVYGSDERWDHLIQIEGAAGVSEDAVPKMAGGEGLCPPEGVGGAEGFRQFLEGNHPLVQEYGPELVARIREGEFDSEAVRFRDPAESFKG